MAIAPVVISFLAQGMPQVQQAFQSIHAAAVKAERAQQAEAQKTERVVKDSAQKRAKEQIAAMKKVDAWQRQAWAAGDREAARHAKNQEREATRAEKGKVKAAKDRAAAIKQVDKELDAWQRTHIKQAERDAVQAEKAKARAIHDRISRTKQAEKDLDAWQRSQQQKPPPASPKASGRNNSAFGRVVESVVGTTARGVSAGLHRAGNISMGLAGTAAQLGGGFSIADSVMGEKNMRKQAAVLSASTLLTGKDGKRIGTDEILQRAKGIGISQAIDPSEVLAGFEAIKKPTGDLDMAMKLAPMVAQIATATGSDFSDVSGLAGNLLANRGKYDPKDAGKVQADIESQIRVLTKQGIVGGVELEDMAKYGARLTAGSVYFSGDKSKNEATLGAMAQMSKQYGGASTPAEAALASQRFSTDVANHSGALKKNLDIDVKDGKGNIKDAQSIILEMLKKTGGDVTRLKETGLGERGVKPLIGAANLYKTAGGGEKGLQAVRDEFSKYTTGVSPEEVDAANKRVLAEQGFEKSMQELRIAAGEQLLPVFKDMLPTLKDLIPSFVELAKVGIPAFTQLMGVVAKFLPALTKVVDTIGAVPTLILAEVGKGLLLSALPALFRGYFANAFKSLQPPVPGGAGVGGGGGSSLAAGAAGATAAAAGAYLIAKPGVEGVLSGQVSGQFKGGQLLAALKNGRPEERSKALAEVQRLQGEGGIGGILGNALSLPTGLLDEATGGKNFAAEGIRKGIEAREIIDTPGLKAAVAEAIRDGVREGARGGNSGSNGAGRSETIKDR